MTQPGEEAPRTPGQQPQATTGGPREAGDRSRIRVGMKVFGAEGGLVGTVKEARDSDVVDRIMQRDVYVPLDLIRAVGADQVVLAVISGHVDDMGWSQPPLMGQEGL